jgi:hypothetical protein
MTFVEFRAAVKRASKQAALVTSLVEVTDLGDGRVEILYRAYTPASGWVQAATPEEAVAQISHARTRTEEEVASIGDLPAVAHV